MRIDETELLRHICIQKSLNGVSFASSNACDVLGEMLNPALLQAALKVKNLQIIQDLIKTKSDLNAFSMHGYTPLMMAAMTGCVQGVHALLSAGVDLNICNKKGQTALWLAASNGYSDAVKILAKAGADLDLSDKKEGKTPLMVAAEFGHLPVISELVKSGVDVNRVSPYGQTALSYAIVGFSRDVKILRNLIKFGADIHHEPKAGERVFALKPLVLATLHRNKDAVKELMKHGASGVESALDFAQARGEQDLIDLLSEKKSPRLVKRKKASLDVQDLGRMRD